MNEPNQTAPSLFERIRVKGRHFDQGGKVTPMEELFSMEGLFRLRDVQSRIPFDAPRLKWWYSSDGPFRKCFVKVPMGSKRSLIYVDLNLLKATFQVQGQGDGSL